MTPQVTIIDYGVGNIFSINNALTFLGASAVLTDAPDRIKAADRLILPGVGAFKNGMKELRERNLIEPIMEFTTTGKPFLGICLGMQMMLDESEEFGNCPGLGLIPGKVLPILPIGADGRRHKIPHIGWSPLRKPEEKISWDNTVLQAIRPGTAAYFVHSFAVVPTDPGHRLADTVYNGLSLTAAIARDNIYGCQFHPEKSGPAGLEILRNFINMP